MDDPVSSPRYEFDANQNRLIADLASGLRIVGLVSLVFGIVSIVGCVAVVSEVIRSPRMIGAGVLLVVATLIYISLGWWLRRAGHSFEKIVRTTGRDIENLMGALNDLRKSFSLVRAIIIIYAVLIIIGMSASMIAMIATYAYRA